MGQDSLTICMTSLRKKAAEEPVIKMVKAMGAENPVSGKDFIKVLDELIAIVGCTDPKMSDIAITRKELKLYPQKVHEELGGDIGGIQEVLPQLSPSSASIPARARLGMVKNAKKSMIKCVGKQRYFKKNM